MDGQMTKREIQKEVMDYAVAFQGRMYHIYMAEQCGWMIRDAVRGFAQKSDRDGVGSRLGAGLSRVMGAVPSNAQEEMLAGNHELARRAEMMGVCLPTDEQAYDEAIERGTVPSGWKESAFR